MFTSLEIRLIQICKSKKPDINGFYWTVAQFTHQEVEFTDAEDVAMYLMDIFYKINGGSLTLGELYLSLIKALFNENPQNFGLIRDKTDSWQNLVAILVSRIRLTEVHKLANLGYVSERPQGNNNP